MGSDSPASVPPVPTREAVEASRGEFLHRGAWSKADIYLAQPGGATIVVKDFARKSLPIRWLGLSPIPITARGKRVSLRSA